MDHSWRPPPLPPIPGNNSNICPICLTSHFPFCPPPAFIENPRFHYPQSQSDFYHQRPHFDLHHPFPNHQSSLNYNLGYNPIDGHVGKRPTWYGSNSSLDTSPLDAIGDPAMVNGNYNNYYTAGVGSAINGYDGYDIGGSKRMKIEPVDHNMGPRGSFMGGEIADKSKVSSDNERILKLIHDHGNAANNTPGGLPKDLVAAPYQSVLHRSEVNQNLPMPHDTIKEPKFSHPGQIQLPPPADVNPLSHDSISSSVQLHNSQPPYSWSESKGHYTHSSFATNFGPVEVPHAYRGQPPLPASPPPPLPVDPPRNHYFEPLASAPVNKPSLFPIAVSSSADSLSSSRPAIHENQSSAQVYYANNVGHHASTLSNAEEFYTRQSSSERHVRDDQPFPLRHLSSEKPNIIDASRIFKQPHRASRPDHLVIILRGLPGSGKSYLAKVLRDIEVENGGEAPRIHSMDEYFMTEVEKAEDSELSKSSGSLRGKRQVMKKVMEYCYEPEMEEAYRASMLKAFKKTLDEGVYSFIIVDDRNLRVADFAQFWATAKRSGYEVYLLEASYKDPAGCAARNVHNFSLDDIQKMAGQWEEAPSLYLKMDVKSLLHADGFDESGIQEVDMDMEDEEAIDDASQESEINIKDHPVMNPKPEVKDLSTSKWSNYMDGNEEGENKNGSVLSGLIQAYNKEGKSVHWGDQGGNVGFSISATRKTNTRSLVIGPGSGYNLKSNPLSEEEYVNVKAVEPKSQNVFQERIRAERESFKAVFDKRRQRIVDPQ